MRTLIVASLAAATFVLAAGTFTARAQAPQQQICNIAAFIDYNDPKIGLGLGKDLIFEGPGESCCVSLVGTPPGEKIQLVCEDQIAAQNKPLNKKGFKCDVFRGRRGSNNTFQTTEDTTLQVGKDGRVTMRCTAG